MSKTAVVEEPTPTKTRGPTEAVKKASPKAEERKHDLTDLGKPKRNWQAATDSTLKRIEDVRKFDEYMEYEGGMAAAEMEDYNYEHGTHMHYSQYADMAKTSALWGTAQSEYLKGAENTDHPITKIWFYCAAYECCGKSIADTDPNKLLPASDIEKKIRSATSELQTLQGCANARKMAEDLGKLDLNKKPMYDKSLVILKDALDKREAELAKPSPIAKR